jgi:D-alanyl-D-alanine carboxypeptidase
MGEQFQEELDSLHSQYRFPGATAAYILPDGTVEAFAVGLSDTELATPMMPESRMLAASIGKTFVGASIIALMKEGSLELDEPISRWLADRPWFSRLPNHETATLRQLLNHTSGIPNHVEQEEFIQSLKQRWQSSSSPFSTDALIEFVLDRPPLFRAGHGWHYTDTGYLLLGLIIESVTGQNYYDEVTRRFLELLHLTLTTPSDRIELFDLAAGYMAENNPFGLPVKTTTKPGVMAWHPGIEWTGGGFVSNPKDLVVWAKALFEGRAIPGDYLDDLLRSVPISEHDSLVRYGAAVAIHEGGPFGTTYGHGGWIPGYSSSLRYYPQYGFSIAFQINTDIGIVDHSTPVIEDMENRLAEIVAVTIRKQN